MSYNIGLKKDMTMLKLLLPIFLFSLAHAKELDANDLGSIYKEAVFFVAVFGVMAIISIIISKKNADKYEIENPIEERKAAKQKLRDEELKNQFKMRALDKDGDKIDRLMELSKMLENGIIDEEEFFSLKQSINIKK